MTHRSFPIKFSRLLPLVLIGALTACQRHEAPAAVTPNVLVQPIGHGQASRPTYSGEIRARHEIDLAFRVGGKLAARLVDAGAEIKPGQLLARLDPADLQLAAAAARAQLAAAESDATTTGAERKRYLDLLTKKFISQTAFDAKDNAYNGARARLEQARSQSQISGNQAAYGALSSDVPGVVTAILADAGQVVAAGQPVMRLARPEEKEVAIAVPENRLAALKAAKSISVTLWADPGTTIVGQLRELSPAADPATRTYPARIRLVNPPPAVHLGMTAQVSLDSGEATPLLVPLTAVIDRGSGPEIWLVREGKAQPQPVHVRQFREDGAVLGDSLKDGELLIVSGLAKLVPGQAVTPLPLKLPVEQR